MAIAGKCWPAFQTQFGFVPCYVNSRLTDRGIPVSCEVDIYGALSEFIGTVVSSGYSNTAGYQQHGTRRICITKILKANTTIHRKILSWDSTAEIPHPASLSFCEMKYQMIMARTLPEEVTQGTLEGDIIPGDITFYPSAEHSRLQTPRIHCSW